MRQGTRPPSTYPDGRQTGYEYDSMGQIQKRTDNTGYSAAWYYDNMGRIQKVEGSDGQEKSFTYDKTGHVTSVTDALGNKTEYAYTPGGRLREIVDAMGSRTEYTYDMADRLVRVCQHGDLEADRTTEYVRNGLGQVICVRDAAGTEESYSYDALGRMTEKTDRDGLRTAYTYTPDGRTESILYDDGSKVEFRYTPLGQPDLVRDWLGETRIERNCYGEPVSITDHAGRTVRYEWGSMGERRCMAYPDGTTVKMQYDELLHQTGLTRSAAGEEDLWIRYKYDPMGRLCEKRSSGGYRTSFCYDKAGRLTELKHEDTAGILDRYCYEYDAAGNKAAIHKERRGLPEESGSYRYTYDGLQRLTGVEKDGGLLRRYQYDPFGNRISMEDHEHGASSEFSYDILNRLFEERRYHSPVVPESQDAYECIRYEYDNRGNLTGEYEGGTLLHGYAYNAMNRLERVWNREGKKAVYSYNGSGQRTAEEKEGIREEYLLDLTRQYNNMLWLERNKKKQRFYWDSNVSVMEEKGRKPQYYLQDEMGSVLRILYDNGNGDRYGYDEFGRDAHVLEQEVKTEPSYTRQGAGQPFGYTGYRYDGVTGAYFAQAREYRPESGRFLAEDLARGSAMAPKTWNRYGYCWNNPTGFVDLNGKTPELPTLQLQPLEKESIVPDLPDRLTIKENESNLSYFFDDDEIDEMKEIAQRIREEQQSQDSGPSAVVAIGLSGSMGDGANVSGSIQRAFDMSGNKDDQGSIGTGVQIGAGVNGGIVISFYPGMKNATDSRGFGAATGGSIGAGLVGGIDILYSGEGNDMKPVGIAVFLSLGVASEFHTNMAKTFGVEEILYMLGAKE